MSTKKMRCGVAAVEALRAAGVSKVFGLMGSSTAGLMLVGALVELFMGVKAEGRSLESIATPLSEQKI